MRQRTTRLLLADKDRRVLEGIVRAPTSAQRDVVRARIVLMAAEGASLNESALRLEVSKPQVILWRRRFARAGLVGLSDRKRSGRPRVYDAMDRHRIAAKACAKPPKGTHWSTRTLAKTVGASPATVQRILAAEKIKPHKTRYWKWSDDPEFEAKMLAIVGLYLNPPENAVVLCVDEKSNIQALDRTQPLLPVRPGAIEKRSFEYTRHGTRSLLAAFEVASGTVTGRMLPRTTSVEFLSFLKSLARKYPRRQLFVVLDNLSVHKQKDVTAWVAHHPRVHLVFTPTHASWLNQIEIWFSILSRRVIRRGVFRSTSDLVRKVLLFIEEHNKHARPFAWTYTGDPLAA